MLSSISLTLNFNVTHPFKEDEFLAEISAVIHAATVQLHTQPLGKVEAKLDKNQRSSPLEEIAKIGLLSVEEGDVLDEGWGQVHNLPSVIASLPRNQREVVLRAIQNGGQLDRAETFETIGRSKDKSLNGFTKPIKKLMDALQKKKELPLDASPLLTPIYDGSGRYQQAQGFTVPKQVVLKMRFLDLT